MISARLAGWRDITGIEREAEYVAICRARLKWWSMFPTYNVAERSAVKTGEDIPAGQLGLWD